MTAHHAWHADLTDVDSMMRQLALHALERSTSAHLDAFFRDGCVTLTGRVDSADSRIEAERAVRAVPGIVQVLNHIEVATLPRQRQARIFWWPFTAGGR